MEDNKLDSGYKVQGPITYAKHSAQKNKYFKDVSVELDYTEHELYPLFYWKMRCALAETYIEESPCDPDITGEQIAAYREYTDFIKNNPEPK